MPNSSNSTRPQRKPSDFNRAELDDALGAMLDRLGFVGLAEPPPGYFSVAEMCQRPGVCRTAIMLRLKAQVESGKLIAIRARRQGQRVTSTFYGPPTNKPK